jgi:hypothetical protein
MLNNVSGRLMELRLLHPENAPLSMLFSVDGRLMELRLAHP